MTRLSVIIPGYNTPEKWWRRCLDSVRKACGPNDEIICIDDCSARRPDFLNAIVKEDPRVRAIFLDENIGQAAVRNIGLEVSRGEWIAFVDSDDEILPKIYDECFGNRNIGESDIMLFGVKVVWTKEQLYKEDIPSPCDFAKSLDVVEIDKLFKGCLFEYVWNRIIRKSFLESNKIRFDVGICPGEDTIFNLKSILANARVCVTPIVGYVYYRFYTSSLARYQPRFSESLQIRNGLWREVKSMLGVGEDPRWKLGELSDGELAFWDMKNMWRYDSPVMLGDRWRWQRANARYFPSPAWVMFLKELFGGFARRYLYFRPIRRWKIKRMFPNAMDMQ